MANPFEAELSSYVVLCNDEGQYSLWLGFAHVPAGWRVVSGPDSRSGCLAYIEQNWTDLRPTSLIATTATDR